MQTYIHRLPVQEHGSDFVNLLFAAALCSLSTHVISSSTMFQISGCGFMYHPELFRGTEISLYGHFHTSPLFYYVAKVQSLSLFQKFRRSENTQHHSRESPEQCCTGLKCNSFDTKYAQSQCYLSYGYYRPCCSGTIHTNVCACNQLNTALWTCELFQTILCTWPQDG